MRISDWSSDVCSSDLAVVRLMMALKLASLAQGASGVRPETVALLEAMLGQGLSPVVPSQGSVGASGDLTPLAHMAAAIIRVGEMDLEGERPRSDEHTSELQSLLRNTYDASS